MGSGAGGARASGRQPFCSSATSGSLLFPPCALFLLPSIGRANSVLRFPPHGEGSETGDRTGGIKKKEIPSSFLALRIFFSSFS